jgi:glycosyltransferase involved in cell wall biosynthesis
VLSVVIPALNEGDSIAETVRATVTALASFLNEYEVVVVDDGSGDSTAENAARAGAVVVRHPHNLGYGAALKSGIRRAKYDVCAIMDADLTYPADRLKDLYAVFSKGYDMVVGARTGNYYRQSVNKSILRKILSFVVQFTAGRRIPDINSGLRIFKKNDAVQFFPRLCDTFSFTTSLTLAFMMNGRFVGYVDIPYYERAGSSKVRLWSDSVRTLEYIVSAANYYDPLKLFALFSVTCVALSGIGFLISMLSGIKAGYFFGLGGLLVAIVVFAMGLLASLLKQVMDRLH